MSDKSLFQKISWLFAMANFMITFACLIWFLVAGDAATELIRYSVGAATFFFLTTGGVLFMMAKANLPSFKMP